MAIFPVCEREFHSREQTLDLLRKRLEGFSKGNKQNVALIGQRYIGKSTLLLKFFNEMKQYGRVVPVFLEMRKEPFQILEKRFIESVLYYIRESEEDFEKALPGKYSELSESLSSLEGSGRRTQEQTLSDLFELLQILNRETGLPVVFILDEFQKLSGFRVRNPYSMLGEKIMTQKEVMYLVSSSAIKQARDILDNDLALLFGNFEVHTLGSYGVGESKRFVKQSLPGFDIAPGLEDFLLSITNNNPFYMESILRDVQGLLCLASDREVSGEILSEAVTNQLHNPATSVHQYFLNTVDAALDYRSARDFEMLIAVAGGCKKSSEIANRVSRSSSQTTRKLEKFINSDILLKFGQVYDYIDPLLKLWIKSVYRDLCLSFKPAHDKSAQGRTREHVNELLERFLSYSRLDIGERLRRLFGLFENDFVELAGRQVKFPKFRGVEKKAGGSGEIPVFASSGKRICWALDYSGDRVSEAHITEFLEKLSGLPRVSMKIFLCLDGIETDAKLLAKEKEIWLWTVHDVNRLCGIYEQPRIMLKESDNGQNC